MRVKIDDFIDERIGEVEEYKKKKKKAKKDLFQ